MAGIKGTLHDYQYTFFIISRPVLLRMKNVSDKRRRENRNIHFIVSFVKIWQESRVLYMTINTHF